MDNKEFAKLLCEAVELLNEGAVKTSKKYKLDNYLKKYGYEGDKKSGTIVVNGRKIEVDRDVNNKTYYSPSGEYKKRPVTAAINPATEKIILGKKFLNLKNNKRRDTVLNHEIGHVELKKGKNVLNSIYRTLEEDKLKKYEVPGTHANVKEFEADLYATQQKNGEHRKRAIRDSYKQTRDPKYIKSVIKGQKQAYMKNNKSYFEALDIKDLDERKKISEERKQKYHDRFKNMLTNEGIKKQIKKINIENEADMNQRYKVLNDKSINRKIYSESVELILSEAIELLDM